MSSYFVDADLFFFNCIFLKVSKALFLFKNNPNAVPVINAPAVRAPVTKADFNAKPNNFMIFFTP